MSEDNRYPGVNYNKQADLWVSRLYTDNRTIGMGCYKSQEDAIKARKAGEAVLAFRKYPPNDDSVN